MVTSCAAEIVSICAVFMFWTILAYWTESLFYPNYIIQWLCVCVCVVL